MGMSGAQERLAHRVIEVARDILGDEHEEEPAAELDGRNENQDEAGNPFRSLGHKHPSVEGRGILGIIGVHGEISIVDRRAISRAKRLRTQELRQWEAATTTLN